ncbi:hypothetical protein HDV06_004733 [Boothiomyces sp. JEL0866]|nr:hypothetical protein HDV06_004722 [Boothiomyces sp. JEL0866]KAJ3320955.1 hypothetical protein HDV06_004733 [Boothiomyces sp. JEL0866]
MTLISKVTTKHMLEERLEIIEQIVSPEPVSANTVIPKSDPKQTIIGDYIEFKKRLGSIDKPEIQKYLKLYQQVEPNLDYSRTLLDNHLMREMVVCSFQELNSLISQLQELKDLVAVADLEFNYKRQAILKVIEEYDLESNDLEKQSEQFLKLLGDYNDFISKISTLFVNYHLILDELENK